jgi:hypothetical protein
LGRNSYRTVPVPCMKCCSTTQKAITSRTHRSWIHKPQAFASKTPPCDAFGHPRGSENGTRTPFVTPCHTVVTGRTLVIWPFSDSTRFIERNSVYWASYLEKATLPTVIASTSLSCRSEYGSMCDPWTAWTKAAKTELSLPC